MTAARPPRVFRVTGGAVLLGAASLVVLAVLVDAAVRTGIGNALLLAPWPLLVLWGVYVTGVASDVRADGSGALVQNLLRRIRMPWSRVAGIGMRWQVEFSLDDGSTVRCFGGPAHSRARRLGPGRTKEDDDSSLDGLATLRRLRAEAAETDAADDGAVTRTWDGSALVALAALVVWAIIAIVVTR